MENQLKQQIEEIYQLVKSYDKRLTTLENKPAQTQPTKSVFAPDDIKDGQISYVGKYLSQDGTIGSTFGRNPRPIAPLFEMNSFEMAKIIDAFSSEERIDLVKLLIQQSLTAKQLMEKLNFATTGKLYHHLGFLEKIGVIRKDGEKFHVVARYVDCILLIFCGVQSLLRD